MDPSGPRISLRTKWTQDRQDQTVAREVAVDLLDDAVRVLLKPGIDFVVNKAAVFVCPINCGKDAIEPQHDTRV